MGPEAIRSRTCSSDWIISTGAGCAAGASAAPKNARGATAPPRGRCIRLELRADGCPGNDVGGSASSCGGIAQISLSNAVGR